MPVHIIDTRVESAGKGLTSRYKPRLGWIEEACIRLLDSAGGVIDDWPRLKAKLSAEKRKYSLPEGNDNFIDRGRTPSVVELEEAWLGLNRKGYVSLKYDGFSLKRIEKNEIIREYLVDGELDTEIEPSRLNFVCDVLSCVFVLPGIFVNDIFGPFSLAFALAMTGSRRRWGLLRVTGTVFGSALVIAFLYNAFR